MTVLSWTNFAMYFVDFRAFSVILIASTILWYESLLTPNLSHGYKDPLRKDDSTTMMGGD
jgi:hypothetical protein